MHWNELSFVMYSPVVVSMSTESNVATASISLLLAQAIRSTHRLGWRLPMAASATPDKKHVRRTSTHQYRLILVLIACSCERSTVSVRKNDSYNLERRCCYCNLVFRECTARADPLAIHLHRTSYLAACMNCRRTATYLCAPYSICVEWDQL